METLTRLVAESLARHGFDRPVDYRRLEWSRWFRCESHHSLLLVPSRPGVFALAEEITRVETAASAVQATAKPSATTTETKESTSAPYATVEERHSSSSSAPRNVTERPVGSSSASHTVEERRFSAAWAPQITGALAPEPSRMLAVTHFFEADDMAFVLDRMLSSQNPMRTRLASGRFFIRYVVISDPAQRRSICNALNQWIVSSAEKATGIGSHFATSLDHVETAASAVPRREASGATTAHTDAAAKNDQRRVNSAPQLNSAIATNIHCSSSFPSGF